MQSFPEWRPGLENGAPVAPPLGNFRRPNL